MTRVYDRKVRSRKCERQETFVPPQFSFLPFFFGTTSDEPVSIVVINEGKRSRSTPSNVPGRRGLFREDRSVVESRLVEFTGINKYKNYVSENLRK